MKLNKSKCGIIALALTSNIPIYNDLDFDNILGIPIVDNYKYLGIYFDRRMTPQPHIEYLQTKLNKFKKLMFILRAQAAP